MYSVHTNTSWKMDGLNLLWDAKAHAQAALVKADTNHAAVVDNQTGEVVYEVRKVYPANGGKYRVQVVA